MARPLKAVGVAILVFWVISACQSYAEIHTLVDFHSFRSGEVKSACFSVAKTTPVKIEAVGARMRSSGELYAYGWIIDLKSRQVVWQMSLDNTSRYRRSERLRRFDGEVQLRPGIYKVYFYAGRPFWADNVNIRSLSDLFEVLGELFSGTQRQTESQRYLKDFSFLMTVSEPTVQLLSEDPQQKLAVVNLTKPGNSRMLRQGFSLTSATTVRIYAIGEYDASSSNDGWADYGRIIDAESRKTVWEFKYENTEPAGGDAKNRRFEAEIRLKPGNYVVTYMTDGSHAYNRWNAAPPDDPDAYGLQIFAASETDRKLFATYTDIYREPVIIQLIHAGNNAYLTSGFRLDRPTSLHIYALGEYDRSEEEMADYGWIEEATTGKRVWEMTPYNVSPAGGAEKNKLFDDVITLPQGNYIVAYVTDGSHSYDHWNQAAPYEPDRWGITISGSGKSFDPKAVHPYEQKDEQADFLIRFVRLGDDEDRRGTFTLSRPTRIHIYAIGEGDKDEMYDYGWIENKRTGRTVWEMTWRNTEPAGGAKKNRKFDDEIWLDAGEYIARFVTDGSHSFNDWNAARPNDPSRWGITITRSQ